MYQKLRVVLLTVSLIGCTQVEETSVGYAAPIEPGKPIEAGKPIEPGKPITPGKPIEPGKPIKFHLNNNNVKVTSDDKQVKIEMPDTILFDYGDSKLKNEAKKVLNDISVELKRIKKANVQIYGHTDNRGDATYNVNLSERRAKEVEAYLKNAASLESITFATKGYGETKPIAPNDTDKNRQKNRRVEIVITPVNK